VLFKMYMFGKIHSSYAMLFLCKCIADCWNLIFDDMGVWLVLKIPMQQNFDNLAQVYFSEV
jgi:hypothetical protein